MSLCTNSLQVSQATDFVQDLVQENGHQIDEVMGRAGAVQDAVVEGQAQFQGTGVVKHAVMNGGGQDGEDVQDAGANAGGCSHAEGAIVMAADAAKEVQAHPPDKAPDREGQPAQAQGPAKGADVGQRLL